MQELTWTRSNVRDQKKTNKETKENENEETRKRGWGPKRWCRQSACLIKDPGAGMEFGLVR